MTDNSRALARRAFLLRAGSGAALFGAAGLPAAAQSPAPPGKRALVLTGAGALGAYEAGAAIALLRAGARFDVICGTSIGAINGAFLAAGDLDGLSTLWHTIARYRVVQPIDRAAPLMAALGRFREPWRGVLSRPYDVLRAAAYLYEGGAVLRRTGFFKSEPVAQLLRERLDARAIRTTYAWSVTNLSSALAEAFYIEPDGAQPDQLPNGTFRVHRLRPERAADAAMFSECVRASSAIPVAFEPVVLTPPGAAPGSYVDGGVSRNAPIAQARHLGASEIVGITADAPPAAASIDSLIDVVFRSYSANQYRLIFDQLADGTTGTHLARTSLVQPSRPLRLTILSFDDQDAVDEAFALGLADGAAGPKPVPPDVPIS